YCGYRAATGPASQFFYIAVNMHWEVNYLGLPKLPKGKHWDVRISTGKEMPEIEDDGSRREICVPARTIVLCGTKEAPVEEKKTARRKSVRDRKNKGDEESR
ncbi:MAG: hypothetical protein K2N00_13200, partial [Lachnospiraceae bacterium]|nr:hypothetical protein [Lachnospiraceae bacterium]